jgi:tetratricopeptide (TPR) repeat protein
MKRILFALLFLPLVAFAASSAPLPSDSPGPSWSSPPPEIKPYNTGCKLLKKHDWARAQKQFEKALKYNEAFPEAHNNLAFVLRMQGPQNYDSSLEHYNRAIALAPDLPEPYMYRGTLYFLTGRKDLAEADYATLQKLKPKLAKELREVIDTGKEELDELYGVSKAK